MNKDDTLFAFYDLAVSPISFDFISFVIQSEVARREAGLKNIKFVIVPMDEFGGHHDNTQFDDKHAHWRMSNVVFPICWLLPTCHGVSICDSRKAATEIFEKMVVHVFPTKYRVDVPIDRHHTGWTVIDAHLGKDIYCIEASRQAKEYARQWIEQHAGGKKCIPLTLREAPFGTKRNSDPEVWPALAKKLKANGYFPVVLRDIDTALKSHPSEYEGIAAFPEGSFNLELRMALYEESYLCMFVSNGPAQICFYDRNVNFLYQVTGDWLTQNPTPFLRMGIDKDENPPFCHKFQRWIWQDQNADHLFRLAMELDADIQRSKVAGTYETDLAPLQEYRIPIANMADRFYDWCGRHYFTSIQEAELSQACWEIAKPDNTDEKEKLLRLANYTLALRNIEKSITILLTVCYKFGEDTDLLTRIGILYDAMDNYEEAIGYYERVLSQNPNAVDVYFRLGVAYKNIGRKDICIDLLGRLVKNGVQTQKLYLELGICLEEVGEPAKALELYQQAEEVDMMDPEIMKRKITLTGNTADEPAL